MMETYKMSLEVGVRDIFAPSDGMKELLKYPKKYKYYTKGKTLDYIAFKIYGRGEVWELLAEYNGIANPYIIPDEIYVLPKDIVESVWNGK